MKHINYPGHDRPSSRREVHKFKPIFSIFPLSQIIAGEFLGRDTDEVGGIIIRVFQVVWVGDLALGSIGISPTHVVESDLLWCV